MPIIIFIIFYIDLCFSNITITTNNGISSTTNDSLSIYGKGILTTKGEGNIINIEIKKPIISHINQLIITTDQVYTPSNKLIYTIVEAIGGGGGGGGVAINKYACGGGGGGGEYRKGKFRYKDLLPSVNITIGRGGLGGGQEGTYYDSYNGNYYGKDGTHTKFGNLIVSNPGGYGTIYGGNGGTNGVGGTFNISGRYGHSCLAYSSIALLVSGSGGSAGMYSNIMLSLVC